MPLFLLTFISFISQVIAASFNLRNHKLQIHVVNLRPDMWSGNEANDPFILVETKLVNRKTSEVPSLTDHTFIFVQ